MMTEKVGLKRASGWWKKESSQLPESFDYTYISKTCKFTVSSFSHKPDNHPIRTGITFGVYDDICEGVVEYKSLIPYRNYYELMGSELRWSVNQKNFGRWVLSDRSEVPQAWWDAVKRNKRITSDLLDCVIFGT